MLGTESLRGLFSQKEQIKISRPILGIKNVFSSLYYLYYITFMIHLKHGYILLKFSLMRLLLNILKQSLNSINVFFLSKEKYDIIIQ